MSKTRFRANVKLPGAELMAAGVTHVRLVDGGFMISTEHIDSIRFETYAGVADIEHRALNGGRISSTRDQVELLASTGQPLIYGLVE